MSRYAGMSEEQKKHLGEQLIQKEGVYKEELIGTARFCEVLAGLEKGDYYSLHPMATMNSEWVRNDGVRSIPAEVKVIAKAGGQKAKLLEMATSAVDEPDITEEYTLPGLNREIVDEVINKREAIDEPLAQRGSVYGKFEYQAEAVGNIIGACITASKQGGEIMSIGSKEIGCIAYIAIKLARFAVEPVGDTSHDLHGYAKLIDELFNGDKK